MNQNCSNCGRGPRVANNRSHANNATKRLLRINLTKVNGRLVCTRCKRTNTKHGLVTA